MSNSLLIPELVTHLARFRGHGLADLKNASLMDRIDTKFVIPVAKLLPLISELEDNYSVLDIRGNRYFRYQSTYFDTDNFELYHLHHNKNLNRHKVRVRHYVDDDTHFLEVKFKNNKDRTIKNRISVAAENPLEIELHRDFLAAMGLPKEKTLKPSLINQYKRIAFASEERRERLTIDFDLAQYSLISDDKRFLKVEGIAIAELKQSRLNRHSPFFQLAREHNIRAGGFSKYCMGVALTMPEYDYIKVNRFKPITRKVTTTISGEV